MLIFFEYLPFVQVLTCKFATVNQSIKNKICTAEEAVKDIPDGSKLLVGGKQNNLKLHSVLKSTKS